MKRIPLFAVLAVLAYAVVAAAAPDVEPWRKIYQQYQYSVPQKFDKEVQAAYIDAGSLTVGGVTLNVSRGTLIYDMPPLPTGGLITAGDSHICHDSVTTATVASCPFGSTLALGIDQILPAAVFGTCNPYLSAANTAIVRCCGFQNDAGAFNVPDASYTITCIK